MPLLNWLTKDTDLHKAKNAPFRLLGIREQGLGIRGQGSPTVSLTPNLCPLIPDTPNTIIQGDNLEALKAILPVYAGQVKCIYIDPPYNTGNAFEHYDDNMEHTLWLSMMYPRLELLREMLAEDGSIWISIDDDESHYLKVIMDEIFGRKNYLGDLIWKKRKSGGNDSQYIWYTETKTSISTLSKNKGYIGTYNDIAYYLLYNGILGDKRPNGGNVLTSILFKLLPEHNGKKVIYGEACRIKSDKLKEMNIVFKQIPYLL
jgi:adenine-specific DNA-methyltransferase